MKAVFFLSFYMYTIRSIFVFSLFLLLSGDYYNLYCYSKRFIWWWMLVVTLYYQTILFMPFLFNVMLFSTVFLFHLLSLCVHTFFGLVLLHRIKMFGSHTTTFHKCKKIRLISSISAVWCIMSWVCESESVWFWVFVVVVFLLV